LSKKDFGERKVAGGIWKSLIEAANLSVFAVMSDWHGVFKLPTNGNGTVAGRIEESAEAEEQERGCDSRYDLFADSGRGGG
jgi:hypothetical protein